MQEQGIAMNQLMRALADQTKSFLESEIAISVHDMNFDQHPITNLELSFLTSVISVNSSINMFFAFSFEKDLIYSILEVFTEGLDYTADEEDLYLEETASEMLNIVVGNSTPEFSADGSAVSISAPIVITEAKSIIKHNQATFYAAKIRTDKGVLHIYLIGPKHLFDDALNYLEGEQMSQLSVMVVDDSLIAIRKLSQMLENLGFHVVATCKTGQEACQKYEEAKPDLVTMDIAMPDMDGIQATKQILSADPEALIVMVTSHGQEQMVINSVEAGAKGYILKPFNQQKISETIENVRNKYQK